MEDLIQRKERVLEMVQLEAERIAEQSGDQRRTSLVNDDGTSSLFKQELI